MTKTCTNATLYIIDGVGSKVSYLVDSILKKIKVASVNDSWTRRCDSAKGRTDWQGSSAEAELSTANAPPRAQPVRCSEEPGEEERAHRRRRLLRARALPLCTAPQTAWQQLHHLRPRSTRSATKSQRLRAEKIWWINQTQVAAALLNPCSPRPSFLMKQKRYTQGWSFQELWTSSFLFEDKKNE